MANCKACGEWFASSSQKELCQVCERVLKRLNGYVEPVVHGRWIRKGHDGPFGTYHLFHCSECDEPNAKEKNYCPNCGAKMDGGNK